MTYKHTQIGYLMILVTVGVLILFFWVRMTSAAEPPSINSGNNLAVTATMVLIVLILVSFASLRVTIDHTHLAIKFGYGIYQKKFLLDDIQSAEVVKNKWYYGWGIRFWFWPRMCIYNISGFDAVEIHLKNGKIYRIGTDEPKVLEQAILQAIN